MTWLFGHRQTLKEYQRYRKSGRDLNHKIIDDYLDKATLDKAIKMLKLGEKGQLIVDSEDELSVLMDFALYEIRQRDGKNAVTRYAEERGGSNAVESELLNAMDKAHTGLFKVNHALRDKRLILLDNLIDPETPVTLLDINLSQATLEGLVLFFRPIRMATFTMTTGVAFVYSHEFEQELTRHWARFDSKDSAKRYAWFFTKNRQSGLKTTYM